MGSTSGFNCGRPQKRTWSGGVDPLVPHGSTLHFSVLLLGNGIDLMFQLRQELQSHSLYIQKQRLHNQEGYIHLVPYQMPQTSQSMQPSVLRVLGLHLQLLQMQKVGHHPTRPEMFQMTQARTAPDGSVMWSNEQSRQVMDQMTQLMNPTPSEESDGTAHLVVLTLEEAFRQVFGRDRPGRIRCGGQGQTLRSWYGPSEGSSSSNTAYQRLLQEQSQQKSEISQQKSEIERMKKIIEDRE
ncbi:hypothetical protein Taro_041480 [Colocasia esculenta]|uniref:Uncharacterized protein n=1 Tax=Colocasia esculenta TaxID=4460 RepID=A0A843WEH4_COLES|nr:hypothetical protein [Colocasia esculenta]